MSVPDDVDFDKVPARALNVSSRMALSWFLNPEQPLRSSSGAARDYRGLAEQMGFAFNDIRNFQRSDDPTLKILEMWEGKNNTTIGLLIKFLEKMERFDVIEDCLERFRNDAVAYLRRNRAINENPIQVPEVTSCRPTTSHTENPNALTVSDIQSGTCTYYDAYVCYAEEDTPFVCELVQYLESPEIMLKLFIKGRDLLLGTFEPDSYIQLIRERCDRMLIILSPEFLKSPACEFQTSFAAGLAIEQRQRKLIPIVIKPCEIPLILRYVSKIDFTKPIVPTWLWDKLIQSIRVTSSSVFVSPPTYVSQPRQALGCSLPEIVSYSSSNPVITFPPTVQHTQILPNSVPPVAALPSGPSVTNTVETIPNQRLSIASVNVQKTTPPSKRKWFHNIKNIKERLTSGSLPSAVQAASSTAQGSSSTATSGYQSQNSFSSESNEDLEKQKDIHEDSV